MNIWVIGRGYPTPANKMWGTFELEQAKMLARKGNKVTYIALTLSFFDRNDKRGIRDFTEDNVRVLAYSHLYFPGKLGVYLEKFEDKCWRQLFQLASENSGKPDLIHVHYPSMISSINEIEQYRKQGVRIYVTEHWSRVLIKNLKKHELNRLRYYAANANCFASVGKPLLASAKKLVPFHVPTEIIPNITSPVYFDTQISYVNDVFVFVAVGRLVPLKQFSEIIKAFQKTFSNNDKVQLKIVGSGSERNTLEAAACNDSRISFTGELSLSAVAKEIAASDALVSFSKYETFGAPVAEAWACGKPVIVSDKTGIVPYVNSRNGIVVPVAESEKLCDALKDLYENHGRFDSEQIRSFAIQNFNDEAITKKLMDMYNDY